MCKAGGGCHTRGGASLMEGEMISGELEMSGNLKSLSQSAN